MKNYTIISYEVSTNLGDYIQTIAAAQFFDSKPTTVDREKLHEKPIEKQRLLVNGWFMENPSHWPPHPDFDPLFLSFHLNPTVQDQLLNDTGTAYFKKHEPIGCRDIYTQQRLAKKGIKAYFSACLTLGLDAQKLFDTTIKKNNEILLLSVFERLERMGKPLGNQKNTVLHRLKALGNRWRYRQAKKRLKRFLPQRLHPISIRSQMLYEHNISTAKRMQAAKNQLRAIAAARLVITSRIHTALPAVALGTPVLFLEDGLEHLNQSSRLQGLSQFFTTCHSKELKYLQWDQIQNPNTHKPFVAQMKAKIIAWSRESS